MFQYPDSQTLCNQPFNPGSPNWVWANIKPLIPSRDSLNYFIDVDSLCNNIVCHLVSRRDITWRHTVMSCCDITSMMSRLDVTPSSRCENMNCACVYVSHNEQLYIRYIEGKWLLERLFVRSTDKEGTTREGMSTLRRFQWERYCHILRGRGRWNIEHQGALDTLEPTTTCPSVPYGTYPRTTAKGGEVGAGFWQTNVNIWDV